jgi:adenosylcobalamin-dependent ribonucleoside-triphosphate reductase
LTDVINWGPTGEAVYDRTYSRVKSDGSRETWPETVGRVVRGNVGLVHGPEDTWPDEVHAEADALFDAMLAFEVLPAGRHLWASGVKGRQYLFNCHVAGWSSITEHVEFVLMRLAEGGGVGANYSTRYLAPQGAPASVVDVHIVCDPSHPDYAEMKRAKALSERYDSNWPGTFEVEDTREGWAAAVTELIESAYRPDLKHKDRVFDVSRVRWKSARLKTMGGTASGPMPLALALRSVGRTLTSACLRVRDVAGKVGRRNSWDVSEVDYTAHSLTPLEAMNIDHAIAQAIVAGGNRRSARMSIVRWDDPYVFDFIVCKADHNSHWSTNISVEIDDEFIRLVTDPKPGDYVTNTAPRGYPAAVWASRVYRAIVVGMLSNGEPGIWNSSLSNEGEPNRVVATNPCGEIALEPWENCNLGHVNMDAFVDEDGMVDMPRLERAHRLVTRFLIRATYGDVVDSKQAATLARNRRIGVGHFGVQGYVVKQGIPFTKAPSNREIRDDLRHLALVVDKAAREYAHTLRIPVPVKTRTVAPTGTIAKMPGRTEGIHPVYARHFLRRVRYSRSDPSQAAQVAALKARGHHVEPDEYAAETDVVTFVTEDQLVAEIRERGLPVELVESADEISLDDMLSLQAFYQENWADNAVSFTVNVPAESHQAAAMKDGYAFIPEPSRERVQEVLDTLRGYLPRLKGTTLMVDGTRPQAPYERMSERQYEDEKRAGVTVSVDASYDEECASGACPIK